MALAAAVWASGTIFSVAVVQLSATGAILLRAASTRF